MAKKPLRPLEFFWAFTKAYDTGDLTRLADFFRHPDAVIGPRHHRALADLFDRRKLAKKVGGQKTPLIIRLPDGSFKLFTELSAETRLRSAADDVRDLQCRAKQRGQRLSQAAAIDAVIPNHPWLKPDAGKRLANYLAGKRGSTRRLSRR
jgi:hypothetical protein